jgi:hypothetical protein
MRVFGFEPSDAETISDAAHRKGGTRAALSSRPSACGYRGGGGVVEGVLVLLPTLILFTTLRPPAFEEMWRCPRIPKLEKAFRLPPVGRLQNIVSSWLVH